MKIISTRLLRPGRKRDKRCRSDIVHGTKNEKLTILPTAGMQRRHEKVKKESTRF